MAAVKRIAGKQVAPHDRYVLISELAYHIGEERRREMGQNDPARDWLEAEQEVDGLLREE